MMTLVYLPLVIVCFLFAGVHGACTRASDLVETLHLGTSEVNAAFDGLDVDEDNEITLKDLDQLFYHSDAEFARSKFLELIKSPNAQNDDHDLRELTTFMNDRPVTLAIYTCNYFKSKALKRQCFSDRILYYAYLVMDRPAILQFYSYFKQVTSKSKRDGICLEDVLKLTTLSHDFEENDAEVLLREVAQERRRFTEKEFTKYVSQEDILDDFRACRKEVVINTARYDDNCLILQLMRFTMNHLTEIEIAGIYNVFDINGNREIESHEVLEATSCEVEIAERFIDMMDQDGDRRIGYGELRHFVKLHTIKLHFERECSMVIHNQRKLTECYKKLLMTAVKEHHMPFSIWFWMPDLDILFIFEELNTRNDGQIKIELDLINGLGWDPELAARLITEISPDEEKDVSLEELSEYLHEPNMIFALAECMTLPKGEKGIKCYVDELKDMLSKMMEVDMMKEFFNHFDNDGDGQLTPAELIKAGIPAPEVLTFLDELGMGDRIITKREFYWYVRQQELSAMFKATGSDDFDVLIRVITEYIRTKMTEYDIQMLFKSMDKNNDYEITLSDIQLLGIPRARPFAKLSDPRFFEKSINFNEFWLHINSPVSSPRKKDLEEACIKKAGNKEKSMACYMKQFWRLRDDSGEIPTPDPANGEVDEPSEEEDTATSAGVPQGPETSEGIPPSFDTKLGTGSPATA